jgi:hypothetical protein
MKNLKILLLKVGANVGSADSVVNEEQYEAAIKEFDALEAAGIEVKIEQVETVTVVKPKSKRGRKAKKALKEQS